MTLTRLLEIDRRLLQDVEQRSMDFAEIEFVRLGAPEQPAQLVAALETILQSSVSDGIGYPRVLLLRKKQIQRGAWPLRRAPAKESAAPNMVPAALTAPRSEEDLTAEAKASYTPEELERWMQMREQAKRLRAPEPKKAEPSQAAQILGVA